MKNEQSLQNWQFQSLDFQKLTELVPGKIFWKKKSILVLGVQILSRMVLG
jgi:hypothetical protein